MKSRFKLARLVPALLATLATLPGCGLAPTAMPGRMRSNHALPSVTRASSSDPQARRVVLRIPGALLGMVVSQRRTWLAEEVRRNAEQGPFSQEMIGGMYPGPSLPTYVIEDAGSPGGAALGQGLHVSADGFKTELEEMTYMNGRVITGGNDLLVPYWDRPGKHVSYYFTTALRKVARPGISAPTIELPTRYISNYGKNFQGVLE